MPALNPFKSFSKKIFLINFLLALFFITSASSIIILFPPDYAISIYSMNFPIIGLLYTAMFLAIYFLLNSLFPNKKHGLLIALFTVIYLIFRAYNLRDPLFLLLLLALFLTSEFLFSGSGTKFRREKHSKSEQSAGS